MGDEYCQSSSPFIPFDLHAILETQKNVTLSAVNTQIEGLQSNLLKAQTADISAPPRSTQHEQKKPLGLFWQFRPSTSNYNDTLYYNLTQDLTIGNKRSDRAERQFTQILLSDGGQKTYSQRCCFSYRANYFYGLWRKQSNQAVHKKLQRSDWMQILLGWALAFLPALKWWSRFQL